MQVGADTSRAHEHVGRRSKRTQVAVGGAIYTPPDVGQQLKAVSLGRGGRQGENNTLLQEHLLLVGQASRAHSSRTGNQRERERAVSLARSLEVSHLQGRRSRANIFEGRTYICLPTRKLLHKGSQPIAAGTQSEPAFATESSSESLCKRERHPIFIIKAGQN